MLLSCPFIALETIPNVLNIKLDLKRNPPNIIQENGRKTPLIIKTVIISRCDKFNDPIISLDFKL